jgi:hypothetical protein
MQVMNINVVDHLGMLGKNARDKVTGFSGVVVSVAFDLYGCVTALIHPGLDKDGGMREQQWFDVSRLIPGAFSVMQPPDFFVGDIAEGKKGPAAKPPSGKA